MNYYDSAQAYFKNILARNNGGLYENFENRNIIRVWLDTSFSELKKEVENTREFYEMYVYNLTNANSLGKVGWEMSIYANRVLFSIQQTLGSLYACICLGNLSDANVMLRKYRDDIFFYLYITVYMTERHDKNKNHKEASQNLEKWIANELANLDFFNGVLKFIGTSAHLNETVKKYNLQASFSKIGAKLNNFVHSNGISFYNKPYDHYKDGEFGGVCRELIDAMNTITITFVLLQTLVSPLTVMSSDYIDHCDMGVTPLPDSQYWVAPFIKDYITEKKDLLDINCMRYLQDNTNMQFYDE